VLEHLCGLGPGEQATARDLADATGASLVATALVAKRLVKLELAELAKAQNGKGADAYAATSRARALWEHGWEALHGG
jgi:hypothetical protein